MANLDQLSSLGLNEILIKSTSWMRLVLIKSEDWIRNFNQVLRMDEVWIKTIHYPGP